MKILKSETGFTLIELVLIIIILGILGAVATIQFGTVISDAKNAGLDGATGPFSAQLAVAVNTIKGNPAAGAGAGAACSTTNNTFDDCVYRAVPLAASGISKSSLDTTGAVSFAICTFSSCTCPAGDCGTAAAPTAVTCGGTTNKFLVVEYSSTTGGLTISTKTACG